jgi:hypothetical protein
MSASGTTRTSASSDETIILGSWVTCIAPPTNLGPPGLCSSAKALVVISRA